MKKSPFLAMCLSIVPGLGQLYVRGLFGGLLRCSFFWVMFVLAILFGFVFVPVVWIWCAFDAASIARSYNMCN